MISDQIRWFAVLLISTILMGCSSEQGSYIVDVRYSEYLTVASKEYVGATRKNAMTTVKVVQLYKPGKVDGVSLQEATQGRLLYESREPSEIEAFFQSLQTSGASVECGIGGSPAILVVAYDRDLPRAGIIRLYKCDTADGSVIGVRPIGDAALSYSRAALDYLRQIGVRL